MSEHVQNLNVAELDVITVQSAGLRKTDEGAYAPTLYNDGDDFGMLGGHMRVLAAQELYWEQPAIPFVFCNGKSAKQIAKFGPDVPSDAEIYAAAFEQGVRNDPRAHSPGATPLNLDIFLEDTSVNTVASIGNLIMLCAANNWQRMGLVSSDYHIPRIRALCGLIFEKLDDTPVDITFISAETVLKELRPGVYDTEIDAAYKSPSALERIKNEQNGCNDIAAGRYHIGEFQLATDKPR